ncbi:SAM-dependent methyltransferase [Planctomonas sp. JC2975]|uniref:SAM-dependent methyltransferase n=1 Tax=Planctomonas sp. JC2975 TaxID=2729626 RepID=UPI001474787A|nr:SAM-dependent methyltransferase [Planctomonas sp. JC2975]NNC12311.1 SAM-dependent methyltransferase [Planctomonas sp. JC2975]
MDGVGKTAVAVAAGRALESSRSDALVRDPYAAELVRLADAGLPFPQAWPDDPVAADPLEQSLLLSAVYVGLRTRFIDDEVTDAGLDQVVILGSGLDPRAWRLPSLDGAAVFELDSAEVGAFMSSAMAGVASGAHRVPLAADVTEPWAADLVRSGFRPDAPTMWVLEGLLPYLGADDQRALVDDIVHLSAPGSRAVIEQATALDASEASEERLETYSRLTGLPMDEVLARSSPPDPAALLADAGWHTARTTIRELEHLYSRALSLDGTGTTSGDRGGFVTATRPAR